MEIRQKTYMSRTTVVATVFVVALMVGVTAFLYYIDGVLAIASVLLLLLLVGMCVSAMFFMPTSVLLDDRILTVVFPFRTKEFMLDEIVEAMPFTNAGRMWRLCGSGAFFGWWGWFSAKGTGKFMIYASNLDHLLLFQLHNGKKYVISCSDPIELCDKINDQKIN